MYSPKIDEELIPRFYRIAKARGVSMTKLINKILKRSIVQLERKEMMKNQIKFPEGGNDESNLS